MDDVVVIGLGELGGVFAHGLLRTGHRVIPVRRADDPKVVAQHVPDPALVAITVGEDDLTPALQTLPARWHASVLLVQNELLPRAWAPLDAVPTVAVVWFEKKKTTPIVPILPTPVAGPRAALVVDALRALDVPAVAIDDEALPAALVSKNLYILTANLAGLVHGGTVGELWTTHRAHAEAVAREVLELQSALLGAPVDVDARLADLGRAIEADPKHGARGRTAPARLARALRHAEELGVDVPTLRALPKG
jgi:ketopantoate reductase